MNYKDINDPLICSYCYERPKWNVEKGYVCQRHGQLDFDDLTRTNSGLKELLDDEITSKTDSGGKGK